MSRRLAAARATVNNGIKYLAATACYFVELNLQSVHLCIFLQVDLSLKNTDIIYLTI